MTVCKYSTKVYTCVNEALADSIYCPLHNQCFTYAEDEESRCIMQRRFNKNKKTYSYFCIGHNKRKIEEYLSFLYTEKSIDECRQTDKLKCSTTDKLHHCTASHKQLQSCADIQRLVDERVFHPEIQDEWHGTFTQQYGKKLRDCRQVCPFDEKTAKVMKELYDMRYHKKTALRKQRNKKSTKKSSKKKKKSRNKR